MNKSEHETQIEAGLRRIYPTPVFRGLTLRLPRTLVDPVPILRVCAGSCCKQVDSCVGRSCNMFEGASTTDGGPEPDAECSLLLRHRLNLKRQVDRSISGVGLKLKLQFYKVQFLLLTGNLKLTRCEVKHAMNIARGRDSSMALLLKAQLEYTRGNHRKSIRLLMASSTRTDAAISSMFSNNLGCIYYKLGKYHSSAVFFSKTLSICSSLQKEKLVKLLTFSQDKSLLITYKCGLSYLACEKPILAARYFRSQLRPAAVKRIGTSTRKRWAHKAKNNDLKAVTQTAAETNPEL